MATIATAASDSERNAGRTRARILNAAFHEIHRRGYHGMRLDSVLEHAGLTKGALYYHFPNKLALGYAVVDEVIEEIIQKLWIRPLHAAKDPMDDLIDRVECFYQLVGDRVVTLGCPLNNLAQEMSPLDEGFRQRLDRVFRIWHTGLVNALEHAKKIGKIRVEVSSDHTATIIMAALEGGIGLTKNCQNVDRLNECTAALAGYLRSLCSAPSSPS